MLRSLSLCIIYARHCLTSETRRILQRTLPISSQCSRPLHLSTVRFSDDDDKAAQPRKEIHGEKDLKRKRFKTASSELKYAAVQAAKAVPGDWTRTAEELLQRLNVLQSSNSGEQTPSPKIEKPKQSLLNTMEVGETFKGIRSSGRLENVGLTRADVLQNNNLYSSSFIRKDTLDESRRGPRIARRQNRYKNLYEAPRLGIFDAEKLKTEGEHQVLPATTDDLWIRFGAEATRRALGAVPKNGFEEMVQWTKQGRLWKFPIDNEADMHDERKYKFHDHIFLERHLTHFPDKGPIRKFMELVVLGLSKNPWITVPEKIEHIQWFAKYFREKQDILNTSIGEQGIMKSDDNLNEKIKSEN